MGRKPTIGVADLPQSMIATALNDAPLEKAVAKGYTLHALEREYIQRVMENAKGNKTEAARISASIARRSIETRRVQSHRLKTFPSSSAIR
jgi:DNA-binding NtrC family response regulator